MKKGERESDVFSQEKDWERKKRKDCSGNAKFKEEGIRIFWEKIKIQRQERERPRMKEWEK